MEEQVSETRIKNAFSKVKRDIGIIRASVAREHEAISQIKVQIASLATHKELSAQTTKIETRIDTLSATYPTNEEFLAANDRIVKEIATLKKAINVLQGIDVSAQVNTLKKEVDTLKTSAVKQKDYDKMLEDAEHNFTEIEKELTTLREEREGLEKLTKRLDTLEKNVPTRKDLKENDKTYEKALKDIDKRIASLEKLEPDTRTIDTQGERITKLEDDLMNARSLIDKRIAEQELDPSLFLSVEEFNEKIDEFNTALDELASHQDVSEAFGSLKERIDTTKVDDIKSLSKTVATLQTDLERIEKQSTMLPKPVEHRLAAVEKSVHQLTGDVPEEIDVRLIDLEREIKSIAQSNEGLPFEIEKRLASFEESVKTLSETLKDVRSEQSALIEEIGSTSTNDKLLEGLTHEVRSLHERLDDLSQDVEGMSVTKGNKGSDLEQVRQEMEFFRNNFITVEELETNTQSVLKELSELKKMKATEAIELLHDDIKRMNERIAKLEKKSPGKEKEKEKKKDPPKKSLAQESGFSDDTPKTGVITRVGKAITGFFVEEDEEGKKKDDDDLY